MCAHSLAYTVSFPRQLSSRKKEKRNHFSAIGAGESSEGGMAYNNAFFSAHGCGVQTVGTSYYYSSLNYLGYSPYEQEDIKPNILWVSWKTNLRCFTAKVRQ